MPSETDPGCILVAIRVRPPGEGCGSATGKLKVNSDAGSISVGDDKDTNGGVKTFKFWSIFQRENNEQLFQAVGRPAVTAVSDGFNATLLSYGQTGSGKTYSMGEIRLLGTEHEGVSHRIVREVFGRAANDTSSSYDILIQYVQIYCEAVHDLLAEDSHHAHKSLILREDKQGGVHVQGAHQLRATTSEEAFDILRMAQARQSFASTKMNKHSSRSHSICQLFITRESSSSSHSTTTPSTADGTATHIGVMATAGHDEAMEKMRAHAIAKTAGMIAKAHGSKTTRGTLTLVDLAGSEDVSRSGARGQTLAEAQKINTSLLALGNVIHALTHKSKSSAVAHAPYRDSSLTRVLAQSLGGDCKTTVLCCCSPADDNITETLSTLRFASRAKLVQNGAKVHATIEVRSCVVGCCIPGQGMRPISLGIYGNI